MCKLGILCSMHMRLNGYKKMPMHRYNRLISANWNVIAVSLARVALEKKYSVLDFVLRKKTPGKQTECEIEVDTVAN